MATKVEYPLAQVLEIKKKRVEKAEKVVLEKKQALKLELEKLQKCKDERDKVLKHRQDKLNQLRDELDGGTTTDKIQQMKVYLKVVDERLAIEERKVQKQEEQVAIAEQNLLMAEEELRKRRQEVDKILTHKDDWLKEKRKEIDLEQEREMDEIGQVLHSIHRRRGY